MKYKAVAFVESGNIAGGYYFYNITFKEALDKMKEIGTNPILNFKMSISVYPW